MQFLVEAGTEGGFETGFPHHHSLPLRSTPASIPGRTDPRQQAPSGHQPRLRTFFHGG